MESTSENIFIEELKQAENRLKNAKEAYETARINAQMGCKHPQTELVECPNQGRLPPFRVCKLCGYAEEGWYCGYTFLYPDIFSGITKDYKARRFVRGKVHQNGIHVLVKHKRMTLKEMLE